ncbi:MAG: TIGR02281 family clan AA aspartic protease [Rhodoferax sp.]|nr:TIGR02281 family clan AA aspartic protease [Rhodoferax sp.]MDP3650688.1 TIGR02281 family clan AA aspartic protease [Rhodoferax sp.]
MKTAALLCAALVCLAPAAHAQTVALTGMLGGKALLMVDGGAPKSVAAGESFKAVKVVSTQGDTAVLEIAGKRHTLRVGDAPASVGATSVGAAQGNKVVLTAGSGGHFVTQGQINGHSVPLVVDTGASLVSLSVAEAERVGLNYKTGQRVQMSTANGVIPGWRLQLASVKVGDVVVYGVDAIVSSGSMPYVLLGNSFLTRFQMTRTNDQMVLEKRF